MMQLVGWDPALYFEKRPFISCCLCHFLVGILQQVCRNQLVAFAVSLPPPHKRRYLFFFLSHPSLSPKITSSNSPLRNLPRTPTRSFIYGRGEQAAKLRWASSSPSLAPISPPLASVGKERESSRWTFLFCLPKSLSLYIVDISNYLLGSRAKEAFPFPRF